MKQVSLAAVGFERYAKTTRRGAFLAEMERIVPWPALCARIEPFYPKPELGFCICGHVYETPAHGTPHDHGSSGRFTVSRSGIPK